MRAPPPSPGFPDVGWGVVLSTAWGPHALNFSCRGVLPLWQWAEGRQRVDGPGGTMAAGWAQACPQPGQAWGTTRGWQPHLSLESFTLGLVAAA